MSISYYKRLRSTIPNDWEILPLSEILLEAKPGYAAGKRKDDGTPQLRVNNIGIDGQLNLNEILRIPSNLQEKDYYLSKGDILVNNTNSANLVGKTIIVRENIGGYTYSNHITRLRVNTEIVSPEWVHYQLMRFWQLGQFENICVKHVCQAGIRTNELLEQRIPVAPIEEQEFISGVFENLQDLINYKKELINRYSIIKKGMMQHLLTRGIGHTRFKITKIGEIPEEWTITKLGDIVRFKNGINFESSQKGDSGVLTLDVKNMYSNKLEPNLDSLYRVDKDVNQEMLLEKGDILIVRSSVKKEGVGWATCFQGHVEPVTYCGFIIRARVTSNDIFPQFLTNILRSSSCRRQIVGRSGQVAITNISQESLSDVHILLPPHDEQRRIVDSLKSIDLVIFLERESKTNLGELKKGLMQVLLTGKVRVKV